ncbi:MAG: TSUP family transporter [Armatimonadia bacterium]|nr:TSUP family transporter [Armatimonadia bacterium]
MSEIARLGLIFLVVFLTNFQGSITGFGATVLALPFVALLIGLDAAVPVLVIQAWLLAVFIVIEARRHIDWAAFGKLLAFVVIGLPIGIVMSAHLPEGPLKLVLGAFTGIVSVHGLVHPEPPSAEDGGLEGWKGRGITALLPIGGAIHGAFGSGGPLLVVYCARALPDKSLFRVTMSLLWLTLNTILIGQWATSGRLTAEVLKLAGWCAPFMVAGLILGTIAHYRVDEAIFRRILYAVLLIASGMLLHSALS